MRIRRLVGAAAVGVGVLALAMSWALDTAAVPAESSFPLDPVAIRAAALESSGPLPTHINLLEVVPTRKPLATAIGGAAIGWLEMPWTSFQIISPEGTTLVDLPSLENATPAAGAALRRAAATAERVVFTHEHPDHIGGLDSVRPLMKVSDTLRISPLQQTKALAEVLPRLPDVGMSPVGPGVVSIAAPGHTPGSRIIGVLMRSGRLVLLIGDIAWHRIHFEEPRGHPRVSSRVLGEDSEAIGHQLRALHEVGADQSVLIVPSHDGPLLRELASSGALRLGFE